MEKELENSEKKKRIRQPSRPKSAQPGRAPTLSDRRTPPVNDSSPSRAPSLSHSLPSGADLSAPVFLPARSLSLPLSHRPGSPVAESLPRAPLSSLSASWACPVSSAPSALAVDRRVRTRAHRRISRPRRPPMRPAPFLEPRQCPTHTPRLISHNSALSRALPTPPAAVGDPRPRSWPSSSAETAPSLPELHPEVRHPSPCPIPLLRPVFGQFHLRRCSAVAVCRAHVVAGRFSPV
jgi:hypothetical protein